MDREDVRAPLHAATVGIIGLGGLGSNVAWMLVRSGVRRFVLADHDRVEPGNLNRQYYFADQIGIHKTEALSENLRRIEPAIELVLLQRSIDADDLAELFAGVDVLVEAVDRADSKAAIISAATRDLPDVPLVAASGLAGSGPSNRIVTQRLTDTLWMVGDLESDVRDGHALFSSRVTIAAAHEAHAVVRVLLGMPETD